MTHKRFSFPLSNFFSSLVLDSYFPAMHFVYYHFFLRVFDLSSLRALSLRAVIAHPPYTSYSFGWEYFFQIISTLFPKMKTLLPIISVLSQHTIFPHLFSALWEKALCHCSSPHASYNRSERAFSPSFKKKPEQIGSGNRKWRNSAK